MSGWRDNFTLATTGWAFSLSLTENHCALLSIMAVDRDAIYDWRGRGGTQVFIPTVKGLIKRGLVEHNPAAKVVGKTTPGVKIKWLYRLTPAGEHVLELLRLAGAVPEQETVAA